MAPKKKKGKHSADVYTNLTILANPAQRRTRRLHPAAHAQSDEHADKCTRSINSRLALVMKSESPRTTF